MKKLLIGLILLTSMPIWADSLQGEIYSVSSSSSDDYIVVYSTIKEKEVSRDHGYIGNKTALLYVKKGTTEADMIINSFNNRKIITTLTFSYRTIEQGQPGHGPVIDNAPLVQKVELFK